MEQMHEITFGKLSDGTIHLEQSCGLEEPSVILLHPEQIQFIARRLCGMGSATAAKLEDLERRLSILAGDIEFIVTDASIRRQIVDCEDGPEIVTRLDSLLDLAMEFDGGRLLSRGAQTPTQGATNNPNGKPNTDTPPRAENAAASHGVSQLGLDV